MKCVICKHGETRLGTATVTLTRDLMTLVIKDVPSLICDNCGEEYVDTDVAARLRETAEDAVQSGVEVGVRRYVTAPARA